MVNTQFPTGGLIGVTSPTIGADTDQKFSLGVQTEASNGQVWVYVKAAAAINQYDCVAIDNSFNATGMTKALADLGQQPANAPYAIPSASYGWVTIQGQAITQSVIGSTQNNVAVFTTATTGVLGSVSTSQTKIWGLVAVTSAGTTVQTAISFNYIFPHTQIAPFT